ncbi:SpoIIE family protein phosphatase [Streptacidiphilus sp. 4-A2]|nr:SpoIIE family protein phosphatase [Streptacidiphilus sp. 4-A2]
MSTQGRPADVAGALERANTSLRLLADSGVALASILDADEALRRLARLVVPAVAQACVVDLLDDGAVRRVSVVHHDPARALPYAVETPLPGPEGSGAALAAVLRGQGPTMVDDFGPPGAPGSLQSAQQELYRGLDAATVLIVPLQARRTVLGALTLVRSAAAARFDQQEVSFASDLGHRAGLALENARLFALHRHTAEQLQRSLLPDLSGVQNLDLTARYVPAREGAEVGGDWYDAFALTDGSTMLAIGDVVGHDLTAAVRMGQLRNMLRALEYDSGDSPAGVMRRLDAVMQGMTTTELVTIVIARLYAPPSGPWLLQWTNAGHPPPLLALPDGSSRLLEDGLAPVLGVDPALDRKDALIVLPPGSTLLLYTDGLIERPGEDIGRGLTRLRQHGARLARQPLTVFCDDMLESLTAGHFDDVAVLALRVPDP